MDEKTKSERSAWLLVERTRVDDTIYSDSHDRILTSIVTRVRVAEPSSGGSTGPEDTASSRAVLALITGPKAFRASAASFLAAKISRPLYRVNLGEAVREYIGETEETLASLLREGEESEVVLFFDEADALFGKRGEVESANDRFAGMEMAALLRMLKTYKGLCVLAMESGILGDNGLKKYFDYFIDFNSPC